MNQTIGEKIKFLRIQKGLSQSDLAKALYFSNRTISNWEQNVREVSVSNLERLAQLFQVSLDYFSQPTSQSLPPQGAYQQIKVKKIATNDRFFDVLLSLILVNIAMLWVPFDNRVEIVVLMMLAWIIFSFITLWRYITQNRERTKTYVVPLDTNLYYQTHMSKRELKLFKFSLLIQYFSLILISTFYYVGIYGMINQVESESTFNVFVILIYSLITLFTLFVWIKEWLIGVPKPSLAYLKTHYDFGMNRHRAVVSVHFVVVIFLITYINGFGHASFPADLLLFTLFNGLALVLLLRTILVKNVKIYDSYKLMSQHHSKNQPNILS